MRPEPAGVASLGRQIKLSGRAYPLLEVAALVIQKPDRYETTFRVKKGADGKTLQPLFVCSLDDSVWLSEAEAIRHALKAHFDTFYQTNRQPCDPPKGVWTLVAQFDEIILGPPNYHGYQEKLREIHAQRAPRLPFDVFKSKVRFVKEEAVVKQWIEGQSSRLEYTALNVAESRTFATQAEVEAHFRETHAPTLVKSVESWQLRREQSGPRLPEPLHRLLRVTLERERKFPIRTMTALSAAFAQGGLQFFKRDKTVVHVSVARPHYLDITTNKVSTTVQRIIEFIDSTPNPTRKKLVEALAPTPAAPAIPVVPVAAPAPTPAEQTAESVDATTGAAAATVAPTPAPAPVAEVKVSKEQQALLTDLHWLVHQGHVIEFANGKLETAKKPVAKPEPAPRPEKAPKAAKPPRTGESQIGLLPVPAVEPNLLG